MTVKTVVLDQKEYVILPKTEFLKLKSGYKIDLKGAVDALEYGLSSLGRDLRKARLKAGLTQVQLARRLKKSQAMVSSAEAGRVRVGSRYVERVLVACGLPKNWGGKKGS